MDLSSHELFHFTKIEYLKKIIECQCFFPRYNLEFTVLSHDWKRRAALIPVAMVCFCDIPLELSKNHRKRYGNSGIVLNEEWKSKNGLNPIMYIQKDSILSNIFASLMNSPDNFLTLIHDHSNDLRIPKTLLKITDNLKHLSYFLKQFENKKEIQIKYEGKLRTFEKRKFYDEREWRYIPFEAESKNEFFLTIWDFDKQDKLEAANKRMKKYKLRFALDDIKYLIVNKESEKNDLIEILKEKDKMKDFDIKIISSE